jgi:hypothetical protein
MRILTLTVLVFIVASFDVNAHPHSDDVTVTYSPEAKVKRGPNDPVLKDGSSLCSTYPERGPGILRVSKAMIPPHRSSFKRPDFSTLSSKEKRERGVLFAEVIVTRAGGVARIHILRSVGPGFDRLFIEELKSSTFRPGTLEGRPMDVCMMFTALPEVR